MLQDVDASFVTLLCHEMSWHWCALLSRVEHIYLYMSLRGFICPFHHHHGGGGGGGGGGGVGDVQNCRPHTAWSLVSFLGGAGRISGRLRGRQVVSQYMNIHIQKCLSWPAMYGVLAQPVLLFDTALTVVSCPRRLERQLDGDRAPCGPVVSDGGDAAYSCPLDGPCSVASKSSLRMGPCRTGQTARRQWPHHRHVSSHPFARCSRLGPLTRTTTTVGIGPSPALPMDPSFNALSHHLRKVPPAGPPGDSPRLIKALITRGRHSRSCLLTRRRADGILETP